MLKIKDRDIFKKKITFAESKHFQGRLLSKKKRTLYYRFPKVFYNYCYYNKILHPILIVLICSVY